MQQKNTEQNESNISLLLLLRMANLHPNILCHDLVKGWLHTLPSTIMVFWKWDVSKISSLIFLGSFPLNHDCGRNRRNIYLHFPLHVGKLHRSCIVNNPYMDPMGKAKQLMNTSHPWLFPSCSWSTRFSCKASWSGSEKNSWWWKAVWDVS